LRGALTATTYSDPTTIKLPGSTITIPSTSAVIGSTETPISTNVSALVGLLGYLDTLAKNLINNANSFILTHPDPSTWGTYFDKNGAFEKAVNDTITDEKLSGASVITGKKNGVVNQRTSPVIVDTRTDGSSLSYTNVAFKDFKIALSNNCTIGTSTTSRFCGGGMVGAFSNSNSSATVGAITDSLFTGNIVTVGYTLYGSGMVGAFSNSGSATVGNISGSLFTKNTVTTNSNTHDLVGVGVVGAYSNTGSATVGDISGSTFSGNIVTVNGTYGPWGSGVVGAYGAGQANIVNTDVPVTVGNIIGSFFTRNEIKASQGNLRGGGVVGAGTGGTPSTATVGDIIGSAFAGNTVTVAGNTSTGSGNSGLWGGGVVGVFSNSDTGSAVVGDIIGSLFTRSSVTVNNSGSHLGGGGVVGAFSSGTATVGTITGSTFSKNTIKTIIGNLIGGGVVGAYGNTSATLEKISDSHFIGENEITVADTLTGGGIAAAYSNTGSATLGEISKSSFSENEIKVGNTLTGGGVAAAYSNAGSVSIGEISGSLFAGNTVKTTTGTLTGGGMVGAYGSASAIIEKISDSQFIGENKITVADTLSGGGIAAVYSSTGPATLGEISKSSFSENEIKIGNTLTGGGVVGAFSQSGNASIEKISDSHFTGENKITIVGDLTGGGIAAVYSTIGSASIGEISKSSFSENEIKVGNTLSGSGVVGAFSQSGNASIEKISDSHFIGENKITVAGALSGGGIAAVYSSTGPATLVEISRSAFSKNEIKVGNTLNGGGVVGAFSQSGNAAIEKISDSAFTENTLTVTNGNLAGGGVVGAFSQSGSTSIGAISGSTFTGNTIKASSGALYGGLLYSGDDLTIENSSFTNNTFAADTFFGTVSIDTSKSGTDFDPNTHTVTLEAADGKTTRFQGNTANRSNSNSIAFRNIQTPGISAASAVLNIITHTTSSTVALHDPIWVNLVSDSNDEKTFNMTASGNGQFLWAGKNNVSTVTTENTPIGGTLILGSGSDKLTTTLQPDFSLVAPLHTVFVGSQATLDFMSTTSQPVTLQVSHLTIDNGGTLNARLGSAIRSDINSDSGNFDATGANLNFYVPSHYDIVRSPAVLTVSGTADISYSTVDVEFDGSSPTLHVGDKIVLIDASENQENKEDNSLTPANIDEPIQGAGKQGFSLIYDLVLKNDDLQLWAEVPEGGINANPQTQALAEGQLSGLAFLTEVADLAEKSLPFVAELTRVAPGPQAFGTVSGSTVRYETGSHIDADGSHLITGLAVGASLPQHQSALGVFFEYGSGNTRTHNDFANAARVKGQGDTEYQGLGFLGRVDFADTSASHPYLQAALHNGRVQTNFHSPDLKDDQDRRARFKSRSTYYGATLTMGYHWKLGERTGFDLYAKYLWIHENSDSVRLSTGETVKFDALDSRRVRFGTRYNRHLNETKTLRGYIDLAWERELDGKAKAKIQGSRIDAPTLKGNTGIAELGLTFVPNPASPLSLDVGLQGYAGKREGIMGNIKVNYRF
jgi:hypothetical protein